MFDKAKPNNDHIILTEKKKTGPTTWMNPEKTYIKHHGFMSEDCKDLLNRLAAKTRKTHAQLVEEAVYAYAAVHI